jgi:hypothetical protein
VQTVRGAVWETTSASQKSTNIAKDVPMSNKLTCVSWATLLAVLGLTNTGCVALSEGVNLGFLGLPIPVSPYFQDKLEDKFWNHERYERVPILGPITAGGPAVALDPPSDDEVIRALERATHFEGGLPLLHERQWNNVRIVKEKIADYVDPPRFYPAFGPAQLHHAHYKCTVYYTEITYVGWPIPHTTTNEDAQEVIYIDHNHFHMCGNVDTGVNSQF